MKANIRSTMVKTVASALLIALANGTALAAANDENDDGSYVLRMGVQAKATLPAWLTINYIYGNWANVGGNYACQTWTPLTSTIDWGVGFQQTRSCSQNQDRDVTPVMMSPVTREVKNGETFTGSRVVSVSQFQPAVGTRDFINGERANTWSAWSDQGSHYGCASWSPTTDTVNLYDPFTQSRDCSQNQSRTRQVFNVWASGNETPKRIDGDSQTITETENRSVQGTKDYISGQRAGAWTAWANDGAPYSCASWSPSPSTVNLGQNFVQNRNCSQNQTGSRQVFDVWRSGAETLNHVEPRAQTVTVGQTKSATGTKDYITGTNTGAWTSWSNSGGVYGCSSYSPSTASVNYGSSFTQSRSCSQGQARTKSTYNVWASGASTLKSTANDARVVSASQSRGASGSKDYVTGTTAGSWSSWSNSGGLYSCGSYSPLPSTVNYGSSFTQTASCSQNQTRSRTTYYTWAKGGTSVKGGDSDSRTVGGSKSRSATGTKNVITGSQSSTSAWSNSGSLSCGSWGPSPSSVSWGSSFTQNRSCSQSQSSVTTTYNLWSNGSQTIKSQSNNNRTVASTQYQSATGSNDYITGTRTGPWGGWYTTSGASCTTWSPSPWGYPENKTFTQTRSCTQQYYHNRTIYNIWRSGKETTKKDELGGKQETSNQSRTQRGWDCERYSNGVCK